jgi:hypothetical protein
LARWEQYIAESYDALSFAKVLRDADGQPFMLTINEEATAGEEGMHANQLAIVRQADADR